MLKGYRALWGVTAARLAAELLPLCPARILVEARGCRGDLRAFRIPRREEPQGCMNLLGASWVVISGVVSRVTVIITHIRGLITPLITTHEPPSRRAALQTDYNTDLVSQQPRRNKGALFPTVWF